MKLGIYKHYKGDSYEVIGVAMHTETHEELVVYKYVSGTRSPSDHLWVRPKSMFEETVHKDGFDGPRFQFVK